MWVYTVEQAARGGRSKPCPGVSPCSGVDLGSVPMPVRGAIAVDARTWSTTLIHCGEMLRGSCHGCWLGSPRSPVRMQGYGDFRASFKEEESKKASSERKNVGIFRDAEIIISSDGYKKGSTYIEVTCGCTSKRHGDIVGKLRVYRNGLFVISCQCSPECTQGSLTPHDFEKHAHAADRSGMLWSWKNHIWVTIGEDKHPLSKTSLMSHYKFAANEKNEVSTHCSHHRNFHHDEFVQCSVCKKERHFRLQNKEECRIYHDAAADRRWKCADKHHDKISCEAEEERESRKRCRGCPRAVRCEGCSKCVCLDCRYFDCRCRTCVDFIQNAQP